MTLRRVLLVVATGIVLAGSKDARGQSVFHVPSGQTFSVAEERIFVDEWVMEDNSSIVLDSKIRDWTIHAGQARFGNNTRILGAGSDGLDGSTSTDEGGPGGECRDGRAGGNGAHGHNGRNGANIKITIGLISVTDLVVDVRGGRGGNGGNGAKGGKGGRASCGRICSGQEGGNGGTGGNAGNGGRGGDIEISYWLAGNKPVSVGGSGTGLRVLASGGQAGRKGYGGQGGPGGDGRCCPPLDLYCRGGGATGHRGADGNDASKGQDGNVNYVLLPTPRP